MASMSPANFPPAVRISDQAHKLSYTAPKFNRLNAQSTYSSTRFSPRVLDSSTICRCQKSSDNGNSMDDESPRRWDSVFQQNVRNVIKWFDECLAGYRKIQVENDKLKKDESGSLKKEGEVLRYGDEDWDWERWKKHFAEMDEQELIVSLLQARLKHAIAKEDYEDAARIKVAIAAAVTNDTVGRVMSQLNKALKEERYKDAAFVRDHASAGLVETMC